MPLPPTNLQLTAKNSTSATISWTASAGTNIYYKIVLSSDTKKTKEISTTFTLSSLTPSIYTVTVYSGTNNPNNGNETYETVGMINS